MFHFESVVVKPEPFIDDDDFEEERDDFTNYSFEQEFKTEDDIKKENFEYENER